MNCPSCKAPLGEQEQHCPKCGIIVAKWKDPKQRAAEARLAQLAAESSGGLPTWIYGLLIAIIGIPALIIFVPDVGVPLRGAKLRYHLKQKATFQHQATSEIRITGPDGRPMEHIDIKAAIRHEARESDTGGNLTMRRDFQRFELTPVMSGRLPIEKAELSNWQKNWVMNPRGTSIETMVTTNNQMMANAENMKRLNGMRSERAEYGRASFSESASAAAPPSDSYANFLSGYSAHDAEYLDQAFYFKWPMERIKSSASWTQDFIANTSAPGIEMRWRGEVTYKLLKMERDRNGYAAVIEWNSPVNASLNNSSSTGSYRGKAKIDYSTGVLRELEGELNAPANGAVAAIKINRL